jgi:hypothetical protein
MINFTRAFDTAWERMVVILFQPFDLGKWFVIGFSAFLAGLLQGGNGFNGSSFNNNFSNFNKSGGNNFFQYNLNGNSNLSFNQLNSSLHHAISGMQIGLIVVIAAAVVFFVLILALVMYWLGARGQFLLLDNIVRNRGEIAWPWQNYSRQANSLFGFYLLLLAISLVVFLPMVVIGVVMCIPLFREHRWPDGGEIGGFVILGLVYLFFASIFGFLIFVFREFGVPLMFRNGLLARPAFMETLGLIRQHPGSIVVFVLLRIALALAVAVVSVMACCVCCIGVIPYIGTVAILPALIYVRCFTLDCLAQFGPQYDVWTVDVPPPGPTGTFPVIPRPPLG